MTIHIRPHRLFNLIRTVNFYRRMMKVVLPEQDSPVLLETALLVALSKLVRPRAFFEFGTYLGVQTLNLAANLPRSCRVYTLDLDAVSRHTVAQDPADAVLTARHFAREDQIAFLGTPYAEQIVRLYGDSKTFDFSEFQASVDMIYIDGGHDRETLESDSRHAFRMLSRDRFSCVAWHDYGNPTYPQVTDFLDRLSGTHRLYHVEASWLCFYLAGAPDRLLAALDG
jgi:hypothetical protein